MALHRADVLAAAMSLLDAEGLDGLTMRKLAHTLHVHAGTLYWHFADKQALLDAMAEELLGQVQAADPAQPWQQRVRDMGRQVRDALRAHRDGARLLAGTFVAQPNTLRAGEAFLGALRDAGVPPRQAPSLAFVLLYYILGHTIEEQAREDLIASGQWEARLAGHAEAFRDRQAFDMAGAIHAVDAADVDARFEEGLQLFIDGLALRAGLARPTSRPGAVRAGAESKRRLPRPGG